MTILVLFFFVSLESQPHSLLMVAEWLGKIGGLSGHLYLQEGMATWAGRC